MEAEFGVCRQQCSADINSYIAAHPGNLIFNGKTKAYLPADQFSPAYMGRGNK
jgi:hypothetical protein